MRNDLPLYDRFIIAHLQDVRWRRGRGDRVVVKGKYWKEMKRGGCPQRKFSLIFLKLGVVRRSQDAMSSSYLIFWHYLSSLPCHLLSVQFCPDLPLRNLFIQDLEFWLFSYGPIGLASQTIQRLLIQLSTYIQFIAMDIHCAPHCFFVFYHIDC